MRKEAVMPGQLEVSRQKDNEQEQKSEKKGVGGIKNRDCRQTQPSDWSEV